MRFQELHSNFTVTFILTFLLSVPLFASFKFINYRNGDIEHFNSNIGKITIEYLVTDTTIEQKIKFVNLTISNFYSYDDNTIYNKSKYIRFFIYKETLTDKSRSIKFKFPLKDSMEWEGKGIAERGRIKIPYVYRTTVKDTTITIGKSKIECYKIHSKTKFLDGEHSSNIYYFDPQTKRFVRVEISLGIKGVIGYVLRFFKVNKIILYK